MNELGEADNRNGLEVAIIGLAGRFPGARNVRELWENLRGGVESLTRFTDEELEAAGERPELIADPNYVKVGRVIAGDDLFDAPLFGFSPREAELVDPQQRLFLECAWEALEEAGCDPERYAGLVGVFAGIKMTGYLWNIYSNPRILQSVGDLNAQIANDKDYVATRLSYKLHLGGPSVTVQSACSTALVAVHLGCQALLSGDCDMVLAGGVSVRTQQATGYLYREGDILSPDGRCRTFDAGAQGTIFGNGLGIVVLKRLDDALADGDRIWAVIKGSAVNNDSSQRVGFTAPGADGQERVVRAAQAVAEVDPETIGYIEAHGTGTPVGDPIEVTALTRAFRASTDKKGFCALGSVKTNIGHLGAAAGIAGLIKTVLALHHREIPPSLLFERPNPQIDFASSPFYVNTRLVPWERNGAPLRAGVSAFGIGGTNAHAILEEAPVAPPSSPSRPWQLLVLSAKTTTALDTLTDNLAEHLRRQPAIDLADAAFTLQVGRRELEHRRILVCRDAGDAATALGERQPKRLLGRTARADEPPVAYLFSGQGSQHVGMGADLYRGEPVFRREVDRCAEILEPHLGLDLRRVLYPPDDAAGEAAELLGETRLTQPALFTVEHALARLWIEWGVRPGVMLGHSIGEYVAACLAGVFSLEDALALVAARGRLMQSLPPGAMLAVSLPEEEVVALLGKQLSLAAVNAPARSVVSGPAEAVDALEQQLAARGVGCRRLHTSHAFHSQMMEPALAPFFEEVSRVKLGAPRIPFVSDVTGTLATAAEATDPAYWVRHLRGTVHFAQGLGELLAEPHRLLIEVGPGQSLATLARQHPRRGSDHVILASARRPKDSQDDQAVLLGALGQAWLAGARVDWEGFHGGQRRQRLPLPTYPFERQRYWIEPGSEPFAALGRGAARTQELADWFYVPYWKPSARPLPGGEALAEGSRRWLVLADERGLGEAVAERLRQEGTAVATAVVGAGFRHRGGDVYEVDPASPEAHDALLDALEQDGGLPRRIVHLWGVTDDGVPPGSPLLDRIREVSFWSLVHLAQALGRRSVGERIELGVVANGVGAVRGDEPLCPEKALALGPVKVLPQELPFVAARALDVEVPGDGAALAALAELLVDEMAAPAPGPEQVVAYRGGRRWVEAWEPLHLDRTVESRLPLRDEGVYLITGGLGGIGLTLAEHLARACRARLVLTGRKAPPAREHWKEWLALRGEEDPWSRRIRKIQALEDLGAEVLPLAADVVDETRMRQVVEETRRRFGPLHGVVHAAGLPGGGLIQAKTREVAEAVLGPKVRGARVLEATLAGEPLDFFVLCSSTIAVLGNLGQVDYCGANCFLDAFAQDHARRTGVPTVAVNWGAWKEVGMAVDTRVRVGAPAPRPAAPAEVPVHPLLGALVSADDGRRVYVGRLDAPSVWALDEHRVLGKATLPGTCYLEMARAAFEDTEGRSGVEIREVFFHTPLMLADGEVREVRLVLEQDGDSSLFEVASRPADRPGEPWQEHSQGRVAPLDGELAARDVEALRKRCDAGHTEVEGRILDDPSNLVFWGPRWQALRSIHRGEGEALAELELPPAFTQDLETYPLHPALLDVATALTGMVEEENYLPLSYDSLRMAAPLPRRLLSHIQRRDEGSGETLSADVALLDEGGRALVEITGFAMKRVGAATERLRQGGPPAVRPPAAASPAPPAADGGGVALFAQGGMLPAEGVEAFRRILSRRPGERVAVSPRDLNALLEQLARARSGELVDDLSSLTSSPGTAHPRPELGTSYTAPRDDLESQLAGIWEQALGLEKVGVHDNFYELGGDSVLGIQVLARARKAGLELTSSQLFELPTIAELAAALAASSTGGAAAGVATGEGGRFPLPEEERRVVEAALAGSGAEAEDVYPLSPLQEGLLFHTLESPESGLYVEQLSATLEGELVVPSFARAWQWATERHEVLRTSFLWRDLERPLQVVWPRVEVDLVEEDWRSFSEEERRERLAERLSADRRRSFDLSRAPLMRVYLFRTGEDTHRLVWSHHHLLMDGWSSPLLVGQVFSAYEALRRGEALPQGRGRPFRDYIEWLERQDRSRVEDHFRARLGDIAAPTDIGADRPRDRAPGRSEDYDRLEVTLPQDLKAALAAVTRRRRVTLNNVAQGIWALLLARTSGARDVVFGVSLASRPADIAGVEEMIGLFLNALPMRFHLDPEGRFGEWLKEVQAQQSQLLDLAHTPLVEAQRWSGVPRELPLFETILEFWNFPQGDVGGKRSIALRDPRYDVATNYPLSLRVIPVPEIVLQLTYDRRRFDSDTIRTWLGNLETLFAAVVDRPDATLGELTEQVERADREARQRKAGEVAGVAREKLKRRRRRGATGD